MALRRQRRHHRLGPRGLFLAFLALAIQAMLPFFIAVAIARAGNPAYADVPICSSLGSSHHESGANDHGASGSCPICAAAAAAQAFAAPPAPPLPLPVSSARVALSAVHTSPAAFLAASPYQSRGPPAIA